MKLQFCLTTLGLLLAACGASDHFYRLSAEMPATTGGSAISLGVGPVTLPSYIDRAELVYQSGPNEFQIPSNERWAGALRDNIAQALATNLEGSLGARDVVAYPWPAGGIPRRSIVVDVRQFHAISGVDGVLDFSWRMVNSSNGIAIARGTALLREPIRGDGYAAVVAAESRLLARAAEEIARSYRGRD